ncbi:MAG: chemotaxis protein CheA [Rhodocyclales bacterium GWA2_65_20]|nr:MAG: chemotaxis protein CheA [Rhodocyclales bacterium GWA2_65_20]
MAIDMSQFFQVFFEEAGEHLANMESLLLGLDIDNPDAEQLNAVFRAAHSIKGSAGTFGFTDLAEVTHILENLLDRIRKGELALREEMIDAFLDAGDVLKVLLAAHKGEGEANPAAAASICARLRELTTNPATAAAAEIAPAAPAAASATTPAPEAHAGLDLYFVLEGDAAAIQSSADNLLAELGGFGAARVVERPADPARSWHVELSGASDSDAVRSVLDFVARSDSIRVVPMGGSIEAAHADAADGAYGFFANETPAAAVEEAYGFFEPLPEGTQPAAATSDDAYGFFEPLPVAGASAASAGQSPSWTAGQSPSWTAGQSPGWTEPAAAPAAGSDAPDGAYGFFVDPAAAPAAPPPAAPAAKSGGEGESYGFFVELPAPAAEAKPAPVSKPVAEKPEAKRPAVAAKPGGGDTSIRVGVEKVDQLINLVGELVITQAMLAEAASGVDPVKFERLINGLAQLDRNTRDMQESVMSIRMMPMSVVFSRFPRVVRELSQKLGKKVELKMIGEDTELDKGLIERIADPLTHLVRNSLDHGVEMPDDRVAKGKQASGTITLKAYQQSGNIVIEVGDDGAGLNRQKILAKAKERGLPVHDQMTDQEVWMLIFEAGFSTADQVTEVSGRGVGMDVVKRNIAAMGGRVEIQSMTGIGTRMTIKLPLTLAILDGMSVAVGREIYIAPLGYVIESVQADRGMIKSVSGVERLLHVRDEYLPVIALHEVFRIPGAITALDQGIMVILESDGVKAALFVDAMVGQQQVVIKSLETNYRRVSGISGATIMGDGHVALILDVAVLVGMAHSALPAAA